MFFHNRWFLLIEINEIKWANVKMTNFFIHFQWILLDEFDISYKYNQPRLRFLQLLPQYLNYLITLRYIITVWVCVTTIEWHKGVATRINARHHKLKLTNSKNSGKQSRKLEPHFHSFATQALDNKKINYSSNNHFWFKASLGTAFFVDDRRICACVPIHCHPTNKNATFSLSFKSTQRLENKIESF